MNRYRRAPKLNSNDVERTAQAVFLRISRRKWLLIMILERVLWFFSIFFRVRHEPSGVCRDDSNILVIEYWNLGDLAVVVPFLRGLRNAFPRSHIALLVNAGLAGFLEGQGLVDEFIPVRVPWAQHFSRLRKYNPLSGLWLPFFRVMRTVRSRKFEVVFSGRMDVRDNFLMWLTGAPRRIGYGIAGGGRFLTDRISPDLARPHRSDIWSHLLTALGVESRSNGAGFRISADHQRCAKEFEEKLGVPETALLIGVHPGARIPVRRWAEERFKDLSLRLLKDPDVHILWFSDPSGPAAPPAHPRCHLVAKEFPKFLAILSRCRLFICNDSGPMHVAGLMGIPVVAVFGPQNPEWFGPRGPNDRVVIRKEMWCRPCFDYCIFDQPYCLNTISVEHVFQETIESLTVVGGKKNDDQGVASSSQRDCHADVQI